MPKAPVDKAQTAIKIRANYCARRALTAAVRLTWKPLLGALVCAVLLGAAIDHFLPDVHSLPEAARALRA